LCDPPSREATDTDKYDNGIEVRQRSRGVMGERKLAVNSIGPAAKVKLEYDESYDVEMGIADTKFCSCGRLREPIPIHSYEMPSTVTMPSQPSAEPSLVPLACVFPASTNPYQKIGNCEFNEPLLAVEAQAEVYGDRTANGIAGARLG